MKSRNVESSERFTDLFLYTLSKHNISLYRVHVSAGFSKSYLTRIGRGERIPSRGALIKMCDSVDIPANETDELLIALGFIPTQFDSLFASPKIARLNELYAMMTLQEDKQYADQEIGDLNLELSYVITKQIGDR